MAWDCVTGGKVGQEQAHEGHSVLGAGERVLDRAKAGAASSTSSVVCSASVISCSTTVVVSEIQSLSFAFSKVGAGPR